ncbi:single-stranded DNA-binding protein [Spirochaetia bacterium]|nr:single-stranded DNA-binding protein [Spirochaetia bacterium]
MEYEFEGRTEKEAIDKAANELGLTKDDFDVEILETQRSGLFKKGYVKIRVHTNDLSDSALETQPHDTFFDMEKTREAATQPDAQDDFEQSLLTFMDGIITRMGYTSTTSVQFREDRKLGLKIDSEASPILIGKKGKNLDALQLLVNIYAGRQGREDLRVILDSENYRIRREETLVRLAYTIADRVRENRASVLLEPMNPFDRRLIHTTLNDISDVETKSEGDGLFKQVRIYYRGVK